MARLKIVICGAGIAGTALAFWLSRHHDVTIVERHPDIRSTGLQIDLRGHGIEVLKRMGLETPFRGMSVKEEGLQFVNSNGKVVAYFPANRTGDGLQSFTTDYEIMRGDLIKLLYDNIKDRVHFLFGTTIDGFKQLGDVVEVQLSNGQKDCYDLLVGADGQWSRTRKQMLGPGAKDPINFLGVYAGYFTIPRHIKDGEAYNGTVYIAPGKRLLFSRRHSLDRVQVYLVGLADSQRVMAARQGGVEQEKAILSELFRSAGWRSEELVAELQESPDFYCEHMGVVRLSHWTKGRVALLGDAAYCPTATTGMGTTSSLVGAYVLAGEIQDHITRLGTSKEALPEALSSYEERFRPFMDTVQDGIEKDKTYWHKMPSSASGLKVSFVTHKVSITDTIDIDAVKRAYTKITADFDKYSLRSYLTDVANWSEDAVNLDDLGNAHVVFENGFIESFKDAFLSSNDGARGTGMQQLQSGMDAVPNAFVSVDRGENSLVDNIIYGARVTEIGTDDRQAPGIPKQAPIKITHEVTANSSKRSITSDYLILAIPYTAQRTIAKSRPFVPKQETAVRDVRYVERWWEGVFRAADQGKDGGLVSDLPIRYTMFPKTDGNEHFKNSNRGVIMAAYTFEQDATILGALSPDRRIQLAAENLNRIFPEANSLDLLEAGASQVFPADELAGGSAFCYFGPMQKTKFLETMQKPDWVDRVFFAGEQASFTHGWIQGAFEAGLRCVQQIWAVASQETAQ
ncbi:hypothetical protein NW752_002288 [Fusarium irregulare]|uniref:FAD-binding domain-containing protein n=1 Tax=Fusarium irregulare TaxID=2494466 RepID=A0A9W8U683_9HYPO|nr:hypothetical protein NW766_011003 [Fusarium irregulare]KAJ4024836.1 hypothetical protein NW752_002288 [Fusarium irregulare]